MEEERRLWRDNLVKPIIEDDKWYPHPTLNYEGNTQGELRDITSKKLVRGSISGGYHIFKPTVAGKRRHMQYHRVLMECFYTMTIPPHYDIDHKDADPLNNTFDNLQILTKKEHAQKTAKQNPGRGVKAMKKRSYRIVRFRIGENGERIDEVFFDSMAEATRKVNATQKRIVRSIKGSIPDSEGYHWANECDNDDLPGEEWLQVPGLREGMLVSNKGRVCYKYLPNPYKTFGSKTERGYFTFKCMNEKMGVHQAALLAFTGPPPTDDHTADHIDRDRGNNCIGNLRWATPSEQAKNQERIRPIEIYNPANPAVTIETFDTGCEAAEEYGSSAEAIYHAVHGTRSPCETRGPFSARFINREKTLSARYADLTNEEKMNRELAFLDYQVEVAKKDSGNRRSNPENLPFGISRRAATRRHPRSKLVAQMTFLGKNYRKRGDDPAVLVRERDEWFNKVVEDHKAFIRQSFDNNAPQSATLPTTD